MQLDELQAFELFAKPQLARQTAAAERAETTKQLERFRVNLYRSFTQWLMSKVYFTLLLWFGSARRRQKAIAKYQKFADILAEYRPAILEQFHLEVEFRRNNPTPNDHQKMTFVCTPAYIRVRELTEEADQRLRAAGYTYRPLDWNLMISNGQSHSDGAARHFWQTMTTIWQFRLGLLRDNNRADRKSYRQFMYRSVIDDLYYFHCLKIAASLLFVLLLAGAMLGGIGVVIKVFTWLQQLSEAR